MSLAALEWSTIEDFADRVADAVGARPYRWFDYSIPAALQHATIDRLRKPYETRLGYIDSAPDDNSGSAIICLGGTVNSARRFDFLAADLSAAHRVISVDWPGRGRSGWLAQQSHYTPALLALAVESLIDGLGLRQVTIVGSSLGGLIGMGIAARRPSLVSRIVLNDIGPEIPGGHRQRRADAVSRYHLFQTPSNLFRRGGAAQKNDGPLSDAIRLHNIMGQTKRCEAGGGREYRHDPRTTQAYAEQVSKDIDQWSDFHALRCPLLLLHGVDSEVMPPEMIRRMQMAKSDSLTVVHVPLTGHTPALADYDCTSVIGAWLAGAPLPAETTLPQRPAPARLLFVEATPEAEVQPRAAMTAAIATAQHTSVSQQV
ncbi:MAG: alpha/beta hydrolase [Azospirillaceae bacterium]|nr:alpha/beta hydrolase [Azospirillaceae bacterium]